MSDKISYIYCTREAVTEKNESINSILSLPKHDHEILICAPKAALEATTLPAYDNLKLIEDDKGTGAVYACNRAYKYSDGRYLSLITDDIIYPENFLDILDFMNSDFMSRKTYKISNSLWDGGPGLAAVGHNDLIDGNPETAWPIDKYHSVPVELCPYPLIPMPFWDRETVVNKLNSYLFNPHFQHRYNDHWLGFFCSKNEEFEPFKWRCPSIKYRVSSNNVSRTASDEYDLRILNYLTSNFEKGVSNYV